MLEHRGVRRQTRANRPAHDERRKIVRRINKELWLLLSLVLIAALIHFLVASQSMALVFYFLPTLYSAYHFGRRHATLTACASVCVVVLLTYANPAMFNLRMEYVALDSRWFDITVWGGVLVVTAYAMGTLYERNQKSLKELKDGYDGMLAILQQFLSNQQHSEADSFRVSSYAAKIAEALGLDAESSEDLRTAALLRNVNEIGISNEILYKAANLSQEELEKGMRKGDSGATKAQLMGGSLRRAIPILVAAQQLHASGASAVDSIIEVQILNLAEKFDSQVNREAAGKMTSAQAVDKIAKESGENYDSMIVDAFVKAFGQKAQAAAQ
ncbi:MAG: HD domain-containing phosphohydrolase [Terriglobales bacterium]